MCTALLTSRAGEQGVHVLPAFAVLSGERHMQEASAHSGQRVVEMYVTRE